MHAAGGLPREERNRLAVGRMYVEGRSPYKSPGTIIDVDEFMASNV